MPQLTFRNCVNLQIELLQAGKPLEAFDRFFSADGIMYANDCVFATGAGETRQKQEPFIAAARSIDGLIADLNIFEEDGVCVFRNRTSFATSDGVTHQIDGLCWQRWESGKISEERYYDGERMASLLADGVLLRSGNPSEDRPR